SIFSPTCLFNFRSIVDTFRQVFSKRSMRWDMGFLYPGLAMHVSPSTNPGGTLEFILDPHREAINVHSLKESSTATIIPILFGALALLAKKAILISKLALILSSAFWIRSASAFGNGNKIQHQYQAAHFNHGVWKQRVSK
ncbi:hypothetical protein NQ314_003895, partial [Rhamnusium bicolor]